MVRRQVLLLTPPHAEQRPRVGGLKKSQSKDRDKVKHNSPGSGGEKPLLYRHWGKQDKEEDPQKKKKKKGKKRKRRNGALEENDHFWEKNQKKTACFGPRKANLQHFWALNQRGA